jgi:hypothetical protein
MPTESTMPYARSRPSTQRHGEDLVSDGLIQVSVDPIGLWAKGNRKFELEPRQAAALPLMNPWLRF